MARCSSSDESRRTWRKSPTYCLAMGVNCCWISRVSEFGGQGVPGGQILRGLAEAVGGGGSVQKTLVFGVDFVGELNIVVGRLAEVEMSRAAFLDADIKDHFAVVAAHAFEVRFDHAGDLIDTIFHVALGGRRGSPSRAPSAWRNFSLRHFMDAKEIDDADPRRLSGSVGS